MEGHKIWLNLTSLYIQNICAVIIYAEYISYKKCKFIYKNEKKQKKQKKKNYLNSPKSILISANSFLTHLKGRYYLQLHFGNMVTIPVPSLCQS